MRHALAALLLAVAVPAAAEDLRLLDTPGAIFGLEAVGRLDAESGGSSAFCTATLIAPDRVLTAAHCVADEAGALRDPETLRFRAGLRNGRTKAPRGVTRYAIHPDYDPGEGPTAANVATDLALLQLDAPVDYWAVPPFRAAGELRRGQPVQVVSYARGREDAPSHEARCSVLARYHAVLGLDCQATFGSSGAPVFVSTSSGLRVAAVISSGGQIDGRAVTYATAVEDALPILERAMPRKRAVDRIATPGVKTLRVGDRSGQGGSILFHRPGG